MTEEQRFRETLKGIRRDLDWYRSCAGQVSRDDMDIAIRDILRRLKEIEPLLDDEEILP